MTAAAMPRTLDGARVRERWHMGPEARGLLLIAQALCAVTHARERIPTCTASIPRRSHRKPLLIQSENAPFTMAGSAV